MREFKGFMRGLNLGGWLEAYADDGWHPVYDCTYNPEMITEKDIEWIAMSGFDHVRLPFEYDVLFNKEKLDHKFLDGIKVVDNLISWCEKYKVNLVLAMHTCPGYSFHNPSNNLENPFLEDENYQEWFFELWRMLANRYIDVRDLLMFEVLNEFVEEPAERWNIIAGKAIKAIREIDVDRLILFGGIHYNAVYGVKYLEVHEDDQRIAYNFHFYFPGLFTHQLAWPNDCVKYDRAVSYPGEFPELKEFLEKYPELDESTQSLNNSALIGRTMDKTVLMEEMQPVVDFINDHPNALLYCGEFGVYKKAPIESKRAWIKDVVDIFDQYNIGSALWTYTDGKSESFSLCDIETRKPHDQKIVDILTRK